MLAFRISIAISGIHFWGYTLLCWNTVSSYFEKIGDKVEIIDSIIPFNIPDGWEFIRLKEIWELISGRDLSPSEYNDENIGVPYITGASNFNKGNIELVRWTPNPQVITHYGDLLITCKGTIGEMAFNNFGDAHIARQIMAIHNNFNLNSEYLSHCICFYINSIKASAKGLIPGISRENILNLILPIPPKRYQNRVVSYIQKANSILSSIEKSLSWGSFLHKKVLIKCIQIFLLFVFVQSKGVHKSKHLLIDLSRILFEQFL